MLRSCDFLIEDGYFKYIPSYSKFYIEWNKVTVVSLENYVIQLGTKITNRVSLEKFDVAADSSGIGIFEGSVWRFLKMVLIQIEKKFQTIQEGSYYDIIAQ